VNKTLIVGRKRRERKECGVPKGKDGRRTKCGDEEEEERKIWGL